MKPTGVVTNIAVDDLDRAKEFYGTYLGLTVEAFNLGWVCQLQSPDGRAVVQLVTSDASAEIDSDISVHIGNDVDQAYADAVEQGLDIVHPLTTEPWGVRRFFVRAPDGTVINLVSHVDD